jgi:BirA family biotin operon repressor/biotin-[acetyl-CoA-carboxylase] ligase
LWAFYLPDIIIKTEIFMNLRDNIIYLLEKNKGKFVSGQEIAEQFNVSRSAVAKSIATLKSEGYNITSVNNLGHCLELSCDILSEQGIKANLECNADVIVYDIIDSTNNEAKRICADGNTNDVIIAANGQTDGRGRRGKSFYSPQKSGLYFSIILHPEIELSDATGITAAAAVAVSQVINETTKKDPKIKWVNDVFIENKKVC